ncbi:MAG: hypothetical protein OHK0013_23900 [Sandaracinaceae bacterium]
MTTRGDVWTLLGGDLAARVVARRELRVRARDGLEALETPQLTTEEKQGRRGLLLARLERPGGVVSYRKLEDDGSVAVASGDGEVFGPTRSDSFDLLDVTLHGAGQVAARAIATAIDRGSVGSEVDTWASGRLTPFGPQAGRPRLLLLHGVLSSPEGAFGSLRRFGLELLAKAFDVWAYAHPTLTVSPIQNARALVAAMSEQADAWKDVTVLAHSRGGLVAELLARGALSPDDRSEHRKALAAWAKTLPEETANDHALRRRRAKQLLVELEELDEALASSGMALRRIVRAGSPMAGSHLAGRRAQVALEVFTAGAKRLAGLLGEPPLTTIAEWAEALVIGFATSIYDPDELPGLGQMRPGSELVQMLRIGLSSKPSVDTIALGSAWTEGGWRAPLGLFELAARLFHGGRHDLAVTTDAMVFAESREPEHFASRVRKQRSVTHLEYFSQREQRDAVDEVVGSVLASSIAEQDVDQKVDEVASQRRRARRLPAPLVTDGPSPIGLSAEKTTDAPYELGLHEVFFVPAESPSVRLELSPFVEELRDALRALGIATKGGISRSSAEDVLFELKHERSQARLEVRAADRLTDAEVEAMVGSDPPLALAVVDEAALANALVAWAAEPVRHGAPQERLELPTRSVAPVVDALSPLEAALATLGVWPFSLPERRLHHVRVVHGSAHGLLWRRPVDATESCRPRRCVLAFHREGEPLARTVAELERIARLHGGARRLERVGRLPKAGRFVVVPGDCDAEPRVDLLLVGLETLAMGGAGLREPVMLALDSWLATQPSCAPGCPVEVLVLLPGQASWERTTVEEAVAVVLEAVPRALDRAEVRARCEVSFVERYEDLAIRAAHACLAAAAASEEGATTWRYLGLEQVNGFYGPRPARAELGGSWARLSVRRATETDLDVAFVDGRAASASFRVPQPTGDEPPLLPAGLVQALAGFDGVLLEVDEASAPCAWERSRFDEGRTLCEALAVMRLLHGTARQSSAPEVPDRTALVVGDPTGGLSGAAEEAKAIADLLVRRRWTVHAPRADVRRALLEGRHGIVHLATHGSAEGGGFVELGKSASERFGLRDVRLMRHAPAVVVLSACDAGKLGAPQLAPLVPSIAMELLTSGVRVFVGAVTEVDDGSARAFMCALYEALLAGASLGIAAHHARHAARKVELGTTWMSFQVWGDPELRLREGRPGIVHETSRPFVHGKEIEAFCATVLGDAQLLGPDARQDLLARVREAEAALTAGSLVDLGVAQMALGRAFTQLGDFASAERHLEAARRDTSGERTRSSGTGSSAREGLGSAARKARPEMPPTNWRSSRASCPRLGATRSARARSRRSPRARRARVRHPPARPRRPTASRSASGCARRHRVRSDAAAAGATRSAVSSIRCRRRGPSMRRPSANASTSTSWPGPISCSRCAPTTSSMAPFDSGSTTHGVSSPITWRPCSMPTTCSRRAHQQPPMHAHPQAHL